MVQSNGTRCRIVVDAMGGDYAPHNAVIGAIQACIEDPSIELFLVGKEQEILNVISSNNLSKEYCNIINADQVITMSDIPTQAMRTKSNSSIVVGVNMIKDKKADAFVSAGNTGAVVAVSMFKMGRLAGVERPTIGTFMPSAADVCTVFDVGAIVDSKPQHLFDYAVMSSIYVKEIFNIENPSIGILSTGEEDEKGNKTTKEAHSLLKNSKLNFIGNIEGNDVLKGKVNIVICDGFIGNILLKFGESVPKFLKHLLKDYAEKSLLNKLKVGIIKNILKEVLKPLDYQNYGGVPLLGVKGISIIGHGSSSVLAIKNMVLRAKEMFDKNLITKIKKSLEEYANVSQSK